MPEQAQRRAPVPLTPESQPEDHQALEELRHLIVAPEQEGLQEIRERLDSKERRAEDVSSVVAEAIQMRRDHGDDQALAEALAPTIQDTLRESVRKDPQVLADALFPVMGPAIRKSISETLRAMLESFNEALEHSLSWRGIQWRFEAFNFPNHPNWNTPSSAVTPVQTFGVITSAKTMRQLQLALKYSF